MIAFAIVTSLGSVDGVDAVGRGIHAINKAAARHNPDLKAKYDNMRIAGKPAKVALVAVMRKLIEMANALVKADRKWTPKTA